MKKLFLFILSTCLTSFSFSQIHEVGFFLGGANFVGDIGNESYIHPNKISGGLVYKYNLNPRIAIRGNYNYISLEGDDKDASNLYRKKRKFQFTNAIHEFAAGIEFNFFNYNIRERKTSFTPYILAQIAAFNYKTPVDFNSSSNTIKLKRETSYTAPIGVGIKGRLSDNMAFAFEASIRFTLKDDLDYTTNKIPVLDFGGNGNDTYVFTGFSIVYTFGRPPCYAYLDK